LHDVKFILTKFLLWRMKDFQCIRKNYFFLGHSVVVIESSIVFSVVWSLLWYWWYYDIDSDIDIAI